MQRDPKIVVSWNALAIGHLAMAGRLLGRNDYLSAAHSAMAFVRENLLVNNRLKSTFAEGLAGDDAFADDYALLLDATLALLEAQWDIGLLNLALWLADTLLTQFQDQQNGGLWLTAHDAEKLIFRPTWFSDDAAPSGNGVAARALLRLSAVTGETRYSDAAQSILVAAAVQMESHLPSHATLLDALEDSIEGIDCVILRGPLPIIHRWQRELARLYAPRRMVVAIPDSAEGLPAWLQDKPAPASGQIYVCRDGRCEALFENFPALIRHLRNGLELDAD